MQLINLIKVLKQSSCHQKRLYLRSPPPPPPPPPPQVMCNAFGIELGPNAWIAIVLPLVIFLCWIRNLDTLTPLSMVANIAIIFSLAVVVYEEFYQFLVHGPPDPNEIAFLRNEQIDYFAYTTLPLFFGGVIYAFEGIGMVRSLCCSSGVNKDRPYWHVSNTVYHLINICAL